MDSSIQTIPLARLALAFVPVALVLLLLARWSLGARQPLYAVGRMLLQLMLVGYALNAIFTTDNAGLVVLVLAVMLGAASWIALRPLGRRTPGMLWRVLVAIGLAGGATLALVVLGVLGADPWYQPRIMVPLGGMIFANAMNSVSLAAERFEAERIRGAAYLDARNTALQAALIPLVNSLLAVGLVSLPGMMTGQILSGISPLIAARYQIVVMCMIFGASGLATAGFLALQRRAPERDRS